MELSSALRGTYRISEGDLTGASKTWTTSVQARMVSVPSFVPQIALAGELSACFRLIQPLVVNMEADNDGSFVVSDDVFFVYGVGQNRREALLDYIDSLCDSTLSN